jgi:hypothetical protein
MNATPQSILLGIDDESAVAAVLEAEQLPTHLPKIYIYAKKGPTEPQLVVGNSRNNMYGVDSFDLRMPWANHATVLANLINAKGNAAMYERVKPLDAGPDASLRVWLDVLETDVPLYQRNTDGSIKIDPQTNLPLPVQGGTTTPGYKVKYVVEPVPVTVAGEGVEGGILLFGQGGEKPGDQTDETTQKQSKCYPLCDIKVPYFGADGNLAGFRMWAPTTKSSNAIDTTLLTQNKVYPLRMACVKKDSPEATPVLVQTVAGEQYVDVAFVPGTINRRTSKQAFVDDVFIPGYQNLQDPTMPPKWGPFGSFHLYQDTVDTLVALFYAAEKTVALTTDFLMEDGEEHRFNFIGGTDSNGIPYQSFVFSKDANGVRFTETTTLYASGGSDGTMNDVEFAKLVSTAVKRYADPDDVLQDTAKYPESFIWDSGFPMATKFDLISFIANRKDTGLGLCTHDTTGAVLTASEESALAVALRTRLAMYPESEYFGTSVVRGIIVGRSGTLINSQYTKPLPLILEIASKTAEYMGAANGKWKAGKSFDRAPRSQVTMFQDINVTFTPFTVRNKDWANGLNWVQSFDRRSYFFPALKTAYDDDTSVLTSFFMMMACIEVEKVGDRAWRAFSGVDTLTNAQLVKEVNTFYNENLTGRFDNRYTINPEAYFTAADLARGFSYSVRAKVYGPNMKTVQTMSIAAHRIEDLAQ